MRARHAGRCARFASQLFCLTSDRQTGLHRDAVAAQTFLDAQCLKIRLAPVHVSRVTLLMAADDSDGMTGQHGLVDAGMAQCSVAG
jgi:hypothetical protein